MHTIEYIVGNFAILHCLHLTYHTYQPFARELRKFVNTASKSEAVARQI